MHFARLGHIPAAEPQAHAAPDGFVHSFVKEIAVAPGAATISHTIPMREDSPLRGGKAEEVAVGKSVRPTVKLGRTWWARVDSNHRPTGYEPGALTAELQALPAV